MRERGTPAVGGQLIGGTGIGRLANRVAGRSPPEKDVTPPVLKPGNGPDPTPGPYTAPRQEAYWIPASARRAGSLRSWPSTWTPAYLSARASQPLR